MIIKQLNREDKFQCLAIAQNATGEVVSVGVNLCWDWRNANSLGNAVIKPTTSTLGLYAGASAFGYPGAYADWPINSYGMVMVEGVHGSYCYNVGAASLSCAGQWQIPTNGAYSGSTLAISGLGLSWTSQTLLISRGAFLMTNDLSGSGFAAAYIRAL